MAGNFEWKKETCNLSVQEQKKRTGWELNPDLQGERSMSYPLDHEKLIQKQAFLSGFNLYFCLETRAKLERLPSK